MFRFHHNMFSQATRGIISGIISFGIALIIFGALILALPAIFVTIAAGLFFLAGVSVISYAIKLYLAAKRVDKAVDEDANAYRKNVRIHTEENHVEF